MKILYLEKQSVFLRHKEVGNYRSQASLYFSLLFLSLLHILVVTKPQNEYLGGYDLAAYPHLRITTTEPG